jgi:hypothetical protein
MTSRVAMGVNVAVKGATIGLLVVALASPDLPQFQGKAFTGRALAYPIALAVVPVAWWLFGRGRMPYPVAVDILIGLPFLIDMAGNALDLYDTIDWWDDANHLVNWFLHTVAIGLLLRPSGLPAPARAGIAIGWAASTAILWELAEYVTFVPGSAEVSTAYADTLGDLALGLLGGTIAAVATAWWPRAEPAPATTTGEAANPAG